MQPSCITGNEIISICLVETYHVFLLSVRQDPIPRRAGPAPTPGKIAFISNRNDIDENQLRVIFVIQLRAFMYIFSSRKITCFMDEKVKRLVFIFTPFRIHSHSSIFLGNVCQNFAMFGKVLQGYFYTFSTICLHFLVLVVYT